MTAVSPIAQPVGAQSDVSTTARDSLPIGSSWLPNRGSGTTRTIPLPSSVSKAKDAETLGRLWQKKREWLRPRRVVSLPLRFFEQFAICNLLLAVVSGRK
jgi:hypothetical protein